MFPFDEPDEPLSEPVREWDAVERVLGVIVLLEVVYATRSIIILVEVVPHVSTDGILLSFIISARELERLRLPPLYVLGILITSKITTHHH